MAGVTSYRLRCGEDVPLGVECAFPVPADSAPERQWLRRLAWLAGAGLLILALWSPVLQLLPENDGLSGAAPTGSQGNADGPMPHPT